MNERDLKYEDFIKICRLCCKRSNNLSPIYHKTEDTSNNFWNEDNDTVADTDSTSAMLLTLGLNVMIYHCVVFPYRMSFI